jgi:hypothetical protein
MKKELKDMSKTELIFLIKKARCGKLLGIDTTNMTKESIIEHLLLSRCPYMIKLINSK